MWPSWSDSQWSARFLELRGRWTHRQCTSRALPRSEFSVQPALCHLQTRTTLERTSILKKLYFFYYVHTSWEITGLRVNHVCVTKYIQRNLKRCENVVWLWPPRGQLSIPSQFILAVSVVFYYLNIHHQYTYLLINGFNQFLLDLSYYFLYYFCFVWSFHSFFVSPYFRWNKKCIPSKSDLYLRFRQFIPFYTCSLFRQCFLNNIFTQCTWSSSTSKENSPPQS